MPLSWNAAAPLLQTARRKPAALIALTLAAGALFKISAFAREAFITAHFGLTRVTDTYFSLQQLPLILATFMFGAFSRAFTPAYAESLHEQRRAPWLPGLLLYAVILGLALTALTLLLAPQIFRGLARSGDRDDYLTLAILSASFAPIVLIGFCSSIWMSRGRSLSAMTLTGVPYLVMTLSLIAIYLAGHLGDLSLPISMTMGFAAMGGYALTAILSQEKPYLQAESLFQPWRFPQFRQFGRQLAASSIETAGYSVSQLTMLYFLARAGTGAVSANNCATRIGMLGFSLFAQPITQFMQARMCAHRDRDRHGMVRIYLAAMASCTTLVAIALYFLRYQVTRLVYQRGNFSGGALEEVTSMMPAWLGYFVVLSVNAVTARYLFTMARGHRYTRNMLGGYLLTNCLRLSVAGRLPAPWIVWCAVAGEGCGLLLNLHACLAKPFHPVLIGAPTPHGVPG